MQHEQTSEIGRIGRAATDEAEAQDTKPLVNSRQNLRALVVREFTRIEEIEEAIVAMRVDIKEAIDELVRRGLSKKGVKMALARRKLVAKGGLEEIDETLALICGIKSLGIQGDLFLEGGETSG